MALETKKEKDLRYTISGAIFGAAVGAILGYAFLPEVMESDTSLEKFYIALAVIGIAIGGAALFGAAGREVSELTSKVSGPKVSDANKSTKIE